MKRKLTEFRRKYLRFKISEQRRKVKLQAIEYKGGKCIQCPAALVFHHINPLEKDFQISGSSRNFEKRKSELDKCVLLCCICHTELHYEESEKRREILRKEIDDEKSKRK